MNTTPKPALLATCLFQALLLAACSGGGGQRLVVSDPPPPASPPPPAPPPAPPPVPCPAPVTGDCIVDAPVTPTWHEYGMTGGRQSDHRLFVLGPGGYLNLKDGEYRFSGGTQIAGATLVVWDTLVSDVEVLRDFTGLGFNGKSALWLSGTVRGNVRNEELVTLRHRCGTGLNVCSEDRRSRIEGNYEQGPTGTLEAVLGWDLQITGTARLDGGLSLISGTSRSYVLPSAPSSILVLRVAGGLSGQFREWNSPGLFLTGSLRYTANDVYFDATRVSLAAAMAAATDADALTLGSASRVDEALGHADRFASGDPASLDTAQRQFLASATSIQHIGDAAQAVRTLDSLSGHAHQWALAALHDQANAQASRMDAHVASLQRASGGGAWFATDGHGQAWSLADGEARGYDRWLGPSLLVGSSVTSTQANLHFDRMGGTARSRSPLATVYAHHRADGWHATGMAGAGRTSLQVTRPIDVADGRAHQAVSRRTIDQGFAHAEVGTELALGAGRLTPFLAADFSVLDSRGFTEHGDTGFELSASASRVSRSSAAAGARYSREWQGGRGWLRLNLDARLQRRVAETGGPAFAAYTGTNAVGFTLSDLNDIDPGFAFDLGLAGSADGLWTWTLDLERRTRAHPWSQGNLWSLGFQRKF